MIISLGIKALWCAAMSPQLRRRRMLARYHTAFLTSSNINSYRPKTIRILYNIRLQYAAATSSDDIYAYS